MVAVRLRDLVGADELQVGVWRYQERTTPSGKHRRPPDGPPLVVNAPLADVVGWEDHFAALRVRKRLPRGRSARGNLGIARHSRGYGAGCRYPIYLFLPMAV